MFAIILWGRVVAHDCGILGQYACRVCGRAVAWRLLKVKVWLLVFSIPLLPYKVKYWAVCEHCKNGHQIEKDHFRLIRPWAELNRKYLANRITIEKYNLYYRSFSCLNPDDREVVHPISKDKRPHRIGELPKVISGEADIREIFSRANLQDRISLN